MLRKGAAMHRVLTALIIALVGLLIACSSSTTVSESPVPTIQPSPVPTVLVLKAPTPTQPVETTPDPYREPRATVTAWFEEDESPYKHVYFNHIKTALWDSAFAHGVYSSGWDEAAEQFTYGVLTEKTKLAIEERAALIGFPLSMLSVEVRRQYRFNSPPIQKATEDFEIALEIEESPGADLAAEFTVVLKNVSPQTLEFTTGGEYAADVVVFDNEGAQLWRHFPPVLPADGASRKLVSGESLRLTVEWDGIDDDQNTAAPGDYQARAFMNFSNTDLATTAIRFTLTPTP
jgi:hypothetical protein